MIPGRNIALDISRSWNRLGPDPRRFAVLSALFLLVPVLDVAGVGMAYPVMVLMQGGEAAIATSTGAVRWILDAVEAIGLTPGLALFVALLALAMSLRAVVEYATAQVATQVSEEAAARIRKEAVATFLSAELTFHLTTNRAEITNVLINETKRIAAVAVASVNLVTGLTIMVVYAVLAAYFMPYVVASAAPIGVAVFIVYKRIVSPAAAYGRELSVLNKIMTVATGEFLGNVRLVKLRSMETEARGIIEKAISDSVVNSLRLKRLSSLLAVTTQPMAVAGLLLVVYIAHTRFGIGLAELGVIALIAYRMVPQLDRVAAAWLTIANNARGVQAFDELLARARAAPALPSGPAMPTALTRAFALRDIRFAYASNGASVDVLTGVDLEIGRGTMVGIVGRSGAGKSTLLDVIARFYDPTAGLVEWDGRDLRDFDLRAYRRRLAMVTQDPLMFDDTILRNVEFGVTGGLTPERMAEVLRLAHCSDFVAALPQGLKTKVGERGVRLSGGQRQRLAFARALASEPDLLLLDEPTSALDSESEAAIQATLAALHGKVTIVVVAHRLATIKRCDKIVVLEGGRAAEIGTHDELIARDGAYRRLFELQSNV
jgi:ABC-type multidrug transport system fused ATPase/permease subunit